MTLNRRWMGGWGLLLAVIALLLARAEGDAGPLSPWKSVQNAAQGYALRAPPGAEVRRYDPEGILQVEVTDGQVLTVRTLDNPGALSAAEWTDAHGLDPTRRGVEPLVPVLPTLERRSVQVGETSAEAFDVAGPVHRTRRTIVAHDTRVHLIDHPAGESDPVEVYDRIVTTFDPGSFLFDLGFESAAPGSTVEIPNLPVPYYSQRDPRWICDQIGSCWCYMGACYGYTGIGDAGCYITAEAMIFDYYTGGYKDPQELDTCLTQNGGYGYWAGCGYGVCAVSYNPLDACSPAVVEYAGFSSNRDVLDADLAAGYPVVAWVDGGTHYVVIIGKQNGKYQVHDPLYNRTEIYSGQIVHFVRYHGPLPTAGPDPDWEPGFPVLAFHPGGEASEDGVFPTVVANIDDDRALEILPPGSPGSARYAWNADSALLAGWPQSTTVGEALPAAGNLSGPASRLEAVIGDRAGSLAVFAPGGGVEPGWPQEISPGVSVPVIADVNGDGLEEIFLAEDGRLLHGFGPDGAPLPGWPALRPDNWRVYPPALADLDGDGDLEIIAATEPFSGMIDVLAYRSSGEPQPGFPLTVPGQAGALIVVGDVDGDLQPEIVVPGAGAEVMVVNPGGIVERTWQAAAPLSPGSAPALADLTGDGVPEVLLQTQGSLEAWDGQGNPVAGWPQLWEDDLRRGLSSPVVGDVDGDDRPEVVFTLQLAGTPDDGELHVYTADGAPLEGFPRRLRLGPGSVPAIADVDQDGRNEIAVTGTPVNAQPGFYERLWVFDLGGEAHGAVEWGQYGGGPGHPNAYPPPTAQTLLPPLPAGETVFLPLVSRPTPDPEPGLSGRVMHLGAGVAGEALEVGVTQGSDWEGQASTLTGVEGVYRFFADGSEPDAEGPLSVRYRRPAGVAGWLAEWRSRTIAALPQGRWVAVSEFDLSDLTLLSPEEGESTTMPATFAWAPRATVPYEIYQFVLLPEAASGDSGWGAEPVFEGPLIHGVTSFTLDDLPEGVAGGEAYRWAVRVYGPDGAVGMSGAAHRVTLLDGGAGPAGPDGFWDRIAGLVCRAGLLDSLCPDMEP